MKKATIITIGDELLIGHTLDTNSFYLADQLTQLGFSVQKIISVGDDKNQIIRTLDDVIQSSDLIILTGGLGTTVDDLTKLALAEYFKSKLVKNLDVLNDVVNFLKKKNYQLTEINEKQAYVPDNAIIFRNTLGTAPALAFHKNNSWIIALQGIPSEMKFIFENQIKNFLIQNFELQPIKMFYINTFGIIEAQIVDILKDFLSDKPKDLKIAFLPSDEGVKIRLSGENEELVKQNLQKVKILLQNYIWAEGKTTMSEQIKKYLSGTGKTLAVAESCTGGLLGRKIIDVSGASEYFKGGIIAYSNEIKQKILKVDADVLEKFGAVSRQTVEQMSFGVMKLFDSDYAIATSGIAGPSGGTKEKPVGSLWVAVRSKKNLLTKFFIFGSHRQTNISKSASAGLFLLIKLLQGEIK